MIAITAVIISLRVQFLAESFIILLNIKNVPVLLLQINEFSRKVVDVIISSSINI